MVIGTTWKRRGIPFLEFYRLRGREMMDWNCCWSRTWFFGLLNVESEQPIRIDLLVDSQPQLMGGLLLRI